MPEQVQERIMLQWVPPHTVSSASTANILNLPFQAVASWIPKGYKKHEAETLKIESARPTEAIQPERKRPQRAAYCTLNLKNKTK